MIGYVLLLIVVGSTIWVGVDASRRDWGTGTGTAGWVIGCLLLWIVFFPIYLAKRGKAPLKEGEVAPRVSAGPNPDRLYRECPHCKEDMRRDAGTCPHCRKESPAWHFHDGHWWARNGDAEPWQWLDEATGTWALFADNATKVPDLQ